MGDSAVECVFPDSDHILKGSQQPQSQMGRTDEVTRPAGLQSIRSHSALLELSLHLVWMPGDVLHPVPWEPAPTSPFSTFQRKDVGGAGVTCDYPKHEAELGSCNIAKVSPLLAAVWSPQGGSQLGGSSPSSLAKAKVLSTQGGASGRHSAAQQGRRGPGWPP